MGGRKWGDGNEGTEMGGLKTGARAGHGASPQFDLENSAVQCFLLTAFTAASALTKPKPSSWL